MADFYCLPWWCEIEKLGGPVKFEKRDLIPRSSGVPYKTGTSTNSKRTAFGHKALAMILGNWIADSAFSRLQTTVALVMFQDVYFHEIFWRDSSSWKHKCFVIVIGHFTIHIEWFHETFALWWSAKLKFLCRNWFNAISDRGNERAKQRGIVSTHKQFFVSSRTLFGLFTPH